MKKSKFLAAVLFSALFIFANTAHAASLVTREATNLDENYQTKITLSFDLPAADEIIDVVVVADTALNGLGMANDAYTNIANFAAQLNASDYIKKANIALVLYGLGSETIFGLTDAAAVNGDFISGRLAANEEWIEDHSFGSNVQNGIERAKAILDASTTGSTKNNRHLVLLTDGSATLYNNADGVSASVVFKGSETNLLPMSNMDSNGDVGSTSRPTTSTTLFDANDEDYANTFAAMFARGSEIEPIAAKAYKYQKSTYTSAEIADITGLAAANNVSIFTEAQVNDLSQYPFTSTEIGAYMGAKALKSVADAGYGVHTIGYLYEWAFEDDGSFCLKYIAIPSRGFVEWTYRLGDLHFHKSKTITAAQFAADFEEITNEIYEELPLLTINDEIGYGTYDDGTPYNFDFVNNADQISVTVDGVELDKEAFLGGMLYRFTSGSHLLVLVHNPEMEGDDESVESVEIQVAPSKQAKKVVITYYEELQEATRKTADGEYKNLNASNRSQVLMGDEVVEELDPVTVSYRIGNVPNPKTDDDIMYLVIPSVVVLGFAGIVARRLVRARR